MINLSYSYPLSARRFLRLVFFALSPGVVTILCHGEGLFPPVFSDVLIDAYAESSADDRAFTIPSTLSDARTDRPDMRVVDGPPPKANDDFATTQEEMPIRIDVLANDRSGETDDDDDPDQDQVSDHDDAEIDRSSVDLDPESKGRQTELLTAEGSYVLDDSWVIFTPALDFFGTTSIQYTVESKGEETSNPATISLTVINVNDAPRITGLAIGTVQATAGMPLTITLEYLNVTDPDGDTNLSMIVLPGANYAVEGNTVTPDAAYSGELLVAVQVTDGMATSETSQIMLNVTQQENQPPSIDGQNQVSFPEDESRTITTGDLQISDPDGDTNFTVQVEEAGENYSFDGATITPTPDYHGPLTVPVTVSDGSDKSDVFLLNVTVESVNDLPSIVAQRDLVTNEDTPLTLNISDITIQDPDNAGSDFSLVVAEGDNYSASGNVISPSPDFEGMLSVSITVSDGAGYSEPFPLQILVQPVNDAPIITGQVALTTEEVQPITLSTSQLTIVDPDTGPEGFTLFVSGGETYSLDGNTVTPNAGFNGMLKVPVFVSDGSASSATYNMEIEVTPVNDPPVITGQQALSMAEGSSITLMIENVIVEDPDNTYPTDFTLIVQPGDNYSFTGNTVTPSPDFTGALSVNVVVNDGASTSAVFPLQITITPVNDAPQITAHQYVSTNEDTPRTISVADIVISDPDNTSGFALTVFSGDNYTVVENTITPSPDYFGQLTVPVQVSDGEFTSNIYDLPVEVIAVNDKPVITGQVPIETAEDTPVALELSHLSVFDVDNTYPSGFSLIISAGSNYSVSNSTVIPATNFNGTLNVNVAVSDGHAFSDPFLFQIQVGDANDAPQITGQATVTTNEESPVTLALSHLSVFDPDNAFPTGFTLLVSPGVNYTVSGTTITPALNFAGVLTVPLRVNDGVNNSASFDFQLQVNPINDPPSFGAIANQQLAENAPAGSIIIRDISKGPFEDDQQLTFIANSSNTAVIEDPVVQYSPGSQTAVLSYVVKPNASGVVTLTVVAIDNGSNTPPHQNSYTASFQVEVLEINTAPTLDVINNINIMEDAELQNITLSGITAGAGETQSLTVSATADKPELLEQLEAVYTSPSVTGLLRFKTKPNVYGSINVSVTVTDNGSGVSPHMNTITRSFTVIIQPVNDLPVFTSAPVLVAVTNETYTYRVAAMDPDGDRLTIGASSKPSWATLTASGNGQAILNGKPPDGALGNTPVTLNASDGSGVAQQSFNIYVNVRPSLTNLSIVTEEDVASAFPPNFFAGGYSDRNENPLQKIVITSLPASGRLVLSDRDVQAGDTIVAASASELVYQPEENFYGNDFFGWNAFDGYHYSQSPARVDISVVSVNDPPMIILAKDTLYYEVDGEAAILSPMLDIIDPDDDTLRSASLRFFAGYRPNMELLEYDATPGIRASFDFETGMLEFTGIASLADYRTALRSVRYLYQNTLDPILEPKGLYYTAHDGEAEGEPVDKVIVLQYTFVEFEIPSAFTPNGDNANDTWVIDRPGGGLEEMDKAVISVYNKQGVLVYRAKGFDEPWDGRLNGELLPSDTYFFTIDLQLRSQKTYRGIVTILR